MTYHISRVVPRCPCEDQTVDWRRKQEEGVLTCPMLPYQTAGDRFGQADLAIGDRIELIEMRDDPDPIPPGSKGTVNHIVDTLGMCQIGVDWDPEVGRSLALAPSSDRWVVIDSPSIRNVVNDLTAIRDELKG